MLIYSRLFRIFLFFLTALSIDTACLYPQENINTAEKDSSQECIVIYGDTRTGHQVHRKVVKAIAKHKPKIIFHTGDLVQDGYSSKDWKMFNVITEDLRKDAEFYPTLGNHERESPLYFKNFDLPGNKRWYFYKRYGFNFIVLDSNAPLNPGSEQYKWLETQLSNIYRLKEPRILIMHHPLFTTGKYAKQAGTLRSELVPLLEEYRVTMVFSGHDHHYERSFYNNIYYIVTAGGGAPLYGQTTKSRYSQKFLKAYHFCVLSLNGSEINLKVYDIDSRLIDEFVVK